MCTIFIVRCICGHEFHRKVIKCAQTIRSQLDLAETDIVDGSGATRSGCICEINLPEEYLKPDICGQCKNKGLICDFLNHDPNIKFDIVRQWQAQKRAWRARKIEVEEMDTDEDANSMQDLEVMTRSSASSATDRGAGTPTSSTRPSDICIPELDHDFGEAELAMLSPLSNCIAARVHSSRTDSTQSESAIEDDELDPASEHMQSLDGVYNLKHRAVALEEKLRLMIAENKKCRAWRAEV